jgi:hypothetical protein
MSSQNVNLPTNTDVYFSHVLVSPYSPVNATTLFLGTQTGQVFRVENAQTNSPQVIELTSEDFPIAYISSIAVGQTEDVLLVTFSNYGVESVWQTVDGGQSWTNVEGNLPDMPIRWAIYHPESDHQVMLATELGIWTTSAINDADVVWAQNATGMANVRVDMITLREADNTVLAATHGRGLFTAEYPLDPTISIAEKEDQLISVSPNPSSGQVNLYLQNLDMSSGRVLLTDISGKLVFEKVVSGNREYSFDFSDLPKGTYVLGIDDGDKVYSEKIVLR